MFRERTVGNCVCHWCLIFRDINVRVILYKKSRNPQVMHLAMVQN
jgi:hypothetical protein